MFLYDEDSFEEMIPRWVTHFKQMDSNMYSKTTLSIIFMKDTIAYSISLVSA